MAVKPIVKTFEYFLDRLLRGFKKDQGREPNNLEMILIKQEAGNKAKDANKVIEVQFGRPFGEEVNKLIESGDVKIGEVTKKNDNVLTREMFQNSNLNKPTIEGQMEKITNASNRIDEIMKEQADMYRPKTDAEIAEKFERQNKEAAERLRKKMKDEPEDKADGGRMGFAGGKIVLGKKILDLLKNNKKIQEAVDNIFGTGDYKMDAEMAAESLVELNPKTFGNKLYEDLDDATRSEIYGAVLRPITTNMAKMRELKKATRPEKTLAAMKEGKGIDMSDPKIAEEFTRFMRETDPEGSKTIEQTVELSNFNPKGRKKNATGGRAGYQEGGGIESRLEQLGGDVTSAEQMLQQINERLESAGSSIPEGGGASIANYTPQLPAGGLGSLASSTPSVQTPDPFFGKNPLGGLTTLDGKFLGPGKIDNQGQDPFSFRDPVTGGGQPANFLNVSAPDKLTPIDPYRNTMLGGLSQDGQRFDSAQNAFDALADYTKKQREISPYTRNVIGTEQFQGEEGFKEFSDMFNKINSPNYTAPSPQLLASSQENLQKALPGLFAKGGRAGYYTGGIVDVEPSLDDIGHGSDALMARTRLVSPGNQATTSTGLNYLLAEDNDNMRVPFAKGKIAKEIVDKGRRGFMKAAGAAGAGIAALKTGLLGLGEKAAPVVEKVAETVSETAQGVPPYFYRLVEKIKFMGDDITEKAATQDRQVVKKYKDYEMTEDVATGEIVIKKRNEGVFYDQDGIISDEYMTYKPGIADEATKGKRPPDEYEEYTVRPDAEGKLRETEGGLDSIDEILEEVGDLDAMTLKKAEGGRIGFAGGKLAINAGRKFLEKVFGKEKLNNIVENDPELEKGMLEVVEMFRNKDKEGLKMYLQKYLPHMDDAEIEDFIVGSGDTAGIEGQLIRLGSGRDYKGKIDMIKEADNMRKLKNFDVEGVSKNAEGGRIGLFLGGGLTAGKGLLRTLLNFMAEKSTHGKKGSEMLQLVNPKQLDKYLNDPATMGKVSPEAPAGIPEIINAKKKEMTEDRSNMVGDLIGTARRIKKVDDNIVNYKKTIINDMIGRGIDSETAIEMAENLAEMVAKNAGKKTTPKITEQGLLELENIQKNLLTKDRKLQAQGGLTTMLGE